MLGGDHKKNFLQYHCSTNKKRLKHKTNLLQFPLHFPKKKKKKKTQTKKKRLKKKKNLLKLQIKKKKKKKKKKQQ